MPKLVEFMESLTQEQDKLVMMGTIKPSKDQDLVVGDLKEDSKINKNLKIHLSKRETTKSLKRSPQAPRKNPKRRRTKEK